MSLSFTLTETSTFTITNARHMAAKVATDLKRLQRLYGKPYDHDITNYEIEVIELLKGGYLKNVTYGFRRDGDWIEPTLRYNAHDLAGSHANDDDQVVYGQAPTLMGHLFIVTLLTISHGMS